MLGKPRGSTLIEVLITMAVFSILMIAMFTVMKIGTNGWRDINAKADVTSDLHRFEADITNELHRGYASSVQILTKSTDFHWAIWFQTAMNDPAFVGLNGVPKLVLGDPLTLIADNTGQGIPQRWILYYVTRMPLSEHQALYPYPCASYATTTGPDTTCVHKWIVRKDISARDGAGNDITLTAANIAPYLADLVDMGSGTPGETGLSEEVNNAAYPAGGVGGSVQRARIVMQDVVSFELARLALAPVPSAPPQPATHGPIILFDVKAFKLLDASKTVTFGQAPIVTVNKDINDDVMTSPVIDKVGTTQVQTVAPVGAEYRPYTVQVDTRVVPQNP